MALLNRLRGTEEPKLPVHQFQAALSEWQEGGMTRAQVLTAFSITSAEEAQLDQVKALYQNAVDRTRFRKVFDNVLLLAEINTVPYETGAKILSRLSGVSAGTE